MAQNQTKALPLGKRLAQNLKLIREHRRISQASLSQRSGLPKSTLSHLESGSANPSISVLHQVCVALGISFEELLAKPSVHIQKVKSEEMPKTQSSKNGSLTRILPDPFPSVDFYQITLETNGNLIGTPQSHRAPRILYAVQGSAELHLAEEVTRLNPGESVLFPGEIAHSFRNRSPERFIGILIKSSR